MEVIEMVMRKKAIADREALLRTAQYFGQPQHYLPVTQARAQIKDAIESVAEGSVVLTQHGRPEAVLVPFEIVETMRSAVTQVLLSELERSWEYAGEVARSRSAEAVETSDDELDDLVDSAVRKARRPARVGSRGTGSGR
jgi:prevent-host-death family protein